MNDRLQPNGQLDFSDPTAMMQLTKTLLYADFGLEIELPEDRLCPPVCFTRFSEFPGLIGTTH
jgi:23S rRNA A1618 N6-methylase RlmF